jgi:Arc/MetJ-type ribon-helix-helix transcriptional regulator
VSIEIAPETERQIREEIERGHFHSVDEIIAIGVQAWYEKHSASAADTLRAKTLVELAEPIRGLFEDGELDFSRNLSPGRPVDLG